MVQLLAKYPEIQNKAREEILKQLNGKELDHESVSKMNYIAMIVKEALRLFVPVPGTARETLNDVVLNGYKIPKGTQVFVSFWSIHHVILLILIKGSNYF
jgi:cytochrome P450